MTFSSRKRHLFLMILFFSFFTNSSVANAEVSYRVTRPITVIQISRDIYGADKYWRKIAYTNNLQPPYYVTVGQILALPMPPTKIVSEQNIVNNFSAPPTSNNNNAPSLGKKIVNTLNDTYIYTVEDRAPTLTMLSVDNYGDRRMVSSIAKWNNLKITDHLSLGQKIILKIKPTLSNDESDILISKYWLNLGNTEMAQRVSNNTGPATNRSVAAENNRKIKQPAAVITPPQPAAVITPPQPAAVITPPQPAAVITPTPQPAAVITPPPQPAAVITPPPQPAAVITPTPQPAAVITPPPQPAAVITPPPQPAAVIENSERAPASAEKTTPTENSSSEYWLGEHQSSKIQEVIEKNKIK